MVNSGIVSTFLNYMVNKFSLEEAIIIWDGCPENQFDLSHHFWNKFNSNSKKYSTNSAISYFVAETSSDYLDMLCDRAGAVSNTGSLEILSTFIYCWNEDLGEEIVKLFGKTFGGLLWEKYCELYDEIGPHGAVTGLLRALDDETLDKFVNRACELYCGRHNKK